jgi:hypothetical protein
MGIRVIQRLMIGSLDRISGGYVGAELQEIFIYLKFHTRSPNSNSHL